MSPTDGNDFKIMSLITANNSNFIKSQYSVHMEILSPKLAFIVLCLGKNI